MASTNLDELSLKELKQLQKDVTKAIKGFEARRKKDALAAAEAAAREHGFALSDLAGTTKPKSSSPAKYRHPENPSVTWTGRGRKPAWFTDAINAGVSEKDLLI